MLKELIEQAEKNAGGQKSIAEGLGRSYKRLCEWKKGIGKPDANEIAYLADIAGLPILETVAEVQKEMSTDYRAIWEKAMNQVVPKIGIEPTTFALRMRCSTD